MKNALCFKVIAGFRKDNVDCIKPVFKEFVCLCGSLDLYGAQLVAIDGSKFKAVKPDSGKDEGLKVDGFKERISKLEEERRGSSRSGPKTR